jgi:sporulation protein YlmC with PRC-barrel domain
LKEITMKRFAIPAISLAVLMASGTAFAQTTPEQQPAQQQPAQQQPAEQPPPAAQKPAEQQPPAVKQDQSAQQPAEQQMPAADSNLAVTVDAKNAVLATSFIGSSVYSAANENVGDINDIVFDEKGAIKAVVIGVGGFLGMGEKDVAVPLEKITVTRDETNAVKLMIQASKEELENAPAFDKTLFQVKTPAPDSTTTTTPPAPSGSDATKTN